MIMISDFSLIILTPSMSSRYIFGDGPDFTDALERGKYRAYRSRCELERFRSLFRKLSTISYNMWNSNTEY